MAASALDHITLPSLEDLRRAHEVIAPRLHRTPVLTSESLDGMMGCELHFKCENLQKAGAFKARGATHAVFTLPDEALERGVATHSSGNHAQALSMAAKARNIPAYIVMPENAPRVKIAGVKSYGGKITFCEPTLQARESNLRRIVEETGAEFIPPFNDMRIISGQSTAGIEFIEEVPGLDFMLAPVGGGGLLCGTALAMNYLSPGTRVIGCEPEGADDAWRSFNARELIPSEFPNTIADGLLTSLGSLTYPIILEFVENIYTVNDDEIIEAMKLIWERMKIVVEPSAAVAFAVVKKHREIFKEKKIGIILSGGNVDLQGLPF